MGVRYDWVNHGKSVDPQGVRGSYEALLESPEENSVMLFDLFISHATEDKAFVEPLARALREAGVTVWYDEFALSLGDRLRRSIDRGISESRYGLVVLSHSFFEKEWPQYELDALTQLETAGRKVLLPIWHNITRDEILEKSAALADRIAVPSSRGTPKIVASILQIVAPHLLSAKYDAIVEEESVRDGVPVERRLFPEVTELRLPRPERSLPLSVGAIVASPDNHSLACIGARGDRVFLSVNGNEGEQFDVFCDHTLVFSPDSRRVACGMMSGDKAWVVLDGDRSAYFYDGIPYNGIVFSPNSERVAFQAFRGGKWLIVIDGTEGGESDATGPPFFSPDSSKVGYIALRGERGVLVVNGREVREISDEEAAGDFEFDAASLEARPVRSTKRISYMQRGRTSDESAAVERVTGARAGSISMSELVPTIVHFEATSRNGLRRAAIVEVSGRFGVVVDGEQGFLHSEVLDVPPVFSSDGEHLAYSAADDGQWRLFVDLEMGESYLDAIVPGSRPCFAGQNVVSLVGVRNGEVVYVESRIE